MAVLAGASLGIVLGWTLPVVRRRTWAALLVSAVIAVTVAVAVYLLVGVQGTFGASVGLAIGAWLHAAFIEYLVGKATVSTGTSKED
jgi:multisubunit Na+/H+ antiporter MnhG subunit